MTTPITTSHRCEHDMRPLKQLFARAKRRAWLLVGTQSLVHALVIVGPCVGLVAPFRSQLRLHRQSLFVAASCSVIVLAVILAIRRRSRIPAYLHRLDNQFDAAGRIISAAEFMQSPHARSPFQSLALADTADWVARRPLVQLPWTWPTRWAAVGLSFVLLTHIACQAPTPQTVQTGQPAGRGKIKVEPPDPGDHAAVRFTDSQHPPPRPPGPNGSGGMFGPAADRSGGVTYGTQQLQSDSGRSNFGSSASSTTSASANSNSPSENSSGTGNSPALSSANSGSSGQGSAPSRRQALDRAPQSGHLNPQAPPGGSNAGRGPGQKVHDSRGVSAERRDIAADAKKGEGNSGDASKRPGEQKPGMKFADGASASSNEPGANPNLDGVELDELAIERLPPDQRERVRQYNANLRRLRQTTQPQRP